MQTVQQASPFQTLPHNMVPQTVLHSVAQPVYVVPQTILPSSPSSGQQTPPRQDNTVIRKVRQKSPRQDFTGHGLQDSPG